MQGDTLYYSQRGIYKKQVGSVWTEKNLWQAFSGGASPNLIATTEHGDIRRAHDGKFYLAGRGDSVNFTAVTGSALTTNNLYMLTLQGYKLDGY
jgi:hypothetical protein